MAQTRQEARKRRRELIGVGSTRVHDDPAQPSLLPLEIEPGFHPINLSYPGLQLIHRSPNVFLVNEFLTSDECDRILEKAAATHLQRSTQSHYRTGQPYESELRTSQHAVMTQREAPGVVAKLCSLCYIPATNWERFKLIRYATGEYFKPHWDGYVGTKSGSGFVSSNRVLTFFCYLSSVPPDAGGETHFPQLNLKVAPRKGTALIHFPATLDLDTRDERCEHEGCMVLKGEKWILNAQMWATPKDLSQIGVRESDTDELSKDLV